MSANGHMTPDEAEAYNLGLLDGGDAQYYIDRIAAFGAIRRAAEMIRGWEKEAEKFRNARDNTDGWYSPPNGRQLDDKLLQIASARILIRIAIGSPKV